MHLVLIGGGGRGMVNFRSALIEDLIARGHHVTALTPELDRPSYRAIRRLGAKCEAIPVSRRGLNPFADVKAGLYLVHRLWALKPDVVLAYTLKAVVYGIIAGRCAGVPRRYALIEGVGSTLTPKETRRAKILRRLVIALLRQALRVSDGVMVQNEEDARFVQADVVGSGTPVAMINGAGVDTDYYYFSDDPSVDCPTFLMMGRLLQSKGVYEFVEAARWARRNGLQAKFRILGPIDDLASDAITTDQLKRWSEEGVVEYIGETVDVRSELARSNVLVLPSVYGEGMPRSVLEAMAMGRPTIVTDIAGCRDAVVDGHTGLVIPRGDAAALSSAIVKLAGNSRMRRRMGRAGRERVLQKYDVGTVNRQMRAFMGLDTSWGQTTRGLTPPSVAQ